LSDDNVFKTISLIHAAGLDEKCWPVALHSMTDLVGGLGASLEVISKPEKRHAAMFAFGLPAVDGYLEHYAPLCKRVQHGFRQKAGSLIHESQFIDERGIQADPFYMEFLAPYDMRYFVGATLINSATEYVLMGVQRSPRQGHVDPREIDLFNTLLPHMRQSLDVMRRLRTADRQAASATEALEWLEDGVLILAASGHVVHANAAAQRILRRNDGIRLKGGVLTFAAPQAGSAFGTALKAVTKLSAREAISVSRDFVAARAGNAPPYVLALRPLPVPNKKERLALLFLRDPLRTNAVGQRMLQQALGLTAAEAGLAKALCTGLSPSEFARERGLSPNTVYTHLSRIKQKANCRRMAELIRCLNDLQSPAGMEH
jgi:DNA-binding CsgD family transcriptional regulator/PAS domain-containing protein